MVNAISSDVSDAIERPAVPAAVAKTLSSARRSGPNRRLRGAANPAKANMAVGSIPKTPMTVPPKPIVSATLASRGAIEVTADRMVKADSAIASKTVTLLANNDRLAVGSWIAGAATAVIGIPPIQCWTTVGIIG
ncbi:hypothetical protein NJB18091_28680 [Mycobacterium marinum]|nr:hypothetical protein MMRN_07480 [Mycobacterium marinum]GJN98910.1 hypothetical protein NJB18091_28680 [Mycobacterium marinum]GJO05496.1 hypothetical protein NJB1907f34b_28430 [Mycobacterium marinum]GJO22186.1 hypothetical protein NJB1728e18_24540 [Mycobacterium marinum]GJO29405.1 hypothetical protein NJB1907f22_24520 [Mycobacterium marinum]